MNVASKSIYATHKGTKLYYNILVKNNVEPNGCFKWIAKLNCDSSRKCCFQKIFYIDIKLSKSPRFLCMQNDHQND